MLRHALEEGARTAVFAESIVALRRRACTRLEATLLTDGNLAVIADAAELPDYLNGIVEIAAGRLTSRKRENLARLCAAVDNVLAGESGGFVPFKLVTDREDVFVFATAEKTAFAAQTSLVLFSFVHPLARTAPCATKLSAWFGLSKAESAIAAELASGKDIADIAAAKALSELTVRTHLRTIFEKTNTHSQRDLVALLLRLAGI
jgi:DNA-binding CsgD family transcriptional regulator